MSSTEVLERLRQFVLIGNMDESRRQETYALTWEEAGCVLSELAVSRAQDGVLGRRNDDRRNDDLRGRVKKRQTKLFQSVPNNGPTDNRIRSVEA